MLFMIGFKIMVLLLFVVYVKNSEFPERECCNPMYPPPIFTTPRTSSATPTGRSGVKVKSSTAVLNCILARQLCIDDDLCFSILNLIPKVCGLELVACSTITVAKCQAALKTLQSFSFFKPTCLCRQPNVDPECNSFRNFLFDHPCHSIQDKNETITMSSLPTCNHALSICNQDVNCIQMLDKFKKNCKSIEATCHADDDEACLNSWINLKSSTLFGCFCPKNHMKKRCDKIFNLINHNPCIGNLPFTFSLYGTKSTLFVVDNQSNNNFLNYWQKPQNFYPYKLYTTTNPLTNFANLSTVTTALTLKTTSQSKLDSSYTMSTLVYHSHRIRTTSGTGFVNDTNLDFNTLNRSYSELTQLDTSDMKNITIIDKVFEDQLENPLLNEISHHELQQMDNSINKKYLTADVYNSEKVTRKKNEKTKKRKGAKDVKNKWSFQSTCHIAFKKCQENEQCFNELQPVLNYCNFSECNRKLCKSALQSFYRQINTSFSFDIAFCLCKKTTNSLDSCILAQEKLHPKCILLKYDNSSTQFCHLIAKNCRKSFSCKNKLENFEQNCAVDSLTKKCTGLYSKCRSALVDILGTDLRYACTCKGVDNHQLYECLGWQRMLWVNPCVVESQKDFNLKISIAVSTYQSETTLSNQLDYITDPFETTITSIDSNKEQYFVTKSTIPSNKRFCAFLRPNQATQFINEGETKRMYHKDEIECSEVCQCNNKETLICHTICLNRVPCKTDFAFYNHAAPAYQAFRGKCLCYSGDFICMKPNPENYKLIPGIYLFLGFSEIEEALLKSHSKLSAIDVVRYLHKISSSEHIFSRYCILSVYKNYKDNLILSLKPSILYKNNTKTRFSTHEKTKCPKLMQIISDKINNQDQEVTSHILLSIFKMADVEILRPVINSRSTSIFSIIFIRLFLFVNSFYEFYNFF